MRKIFSTIAIAAALFAMASCQKEPVQPEIEAPVVELEYETVTFDVAAPSAPETKTSYGETVTFTPELYVAVYVGSENSFGTPGQYLSDVKTEITRTSQTTWSVTLSLVKNYHYDIVFWAQKEKAPYVMDWEKATVTADYKVAANDITRDAFYHLCQNYNYLEQKDGASYKVDLHRPFAQINIGASDYSELVALYEFIGKKDSDLQTTIKTSKATTIKFAVPSVLHVLTGYADTPAAVQFGLAATTPADGAYDLAAEENDIVLEATENGATVEKHYTLVGTNYVFANQHKPENPTADLTLTFAYNGSSFDINVPNVPYARNYQTNILGNFFTSNAAFDVVIVPGFDGAIDKNINK